MIEQQPALAGLDWDRSGTNLHALPCALLEWSRSHHVAVLAPEAHIGRLAIEDVAEGSVASVRRTREHGEVAIDLLGEQHAVAVVGQEGVLQLVEGLEVGGPCHADGWAVVAVAPCDIVFVLYLAHTWVVAIHPLSHFLVVALETERFFIDVPLLAILREAYVKHHAAVGIIAAENASETIAKGYYGTVEDTVAGGQQVAGDDGVVAATPHYILAVLRTLFPRHVGQGLSFNNQFAHNRDDFGCMNIIVSCLDR